MFCEIDPKCNLNWEEDFEFCEKCQEYVDAINKVKSIIDFMENLTENEDVYEKHINKMKEIKDNMITDWEEFREENFS